MLNGSIALIYSPSKAHAIFLNPTVTYSIAQNWDFDLVGQIAFNEDDGFKSPIQGLFMRIKYSY
jgi:hypothetical protein